MSTKEKSEVAVELREALEEGNVVRLTSCLNDYKGFYAVKYFLEAISDYNQLEMFGAFRLIEKAAEERP